MKIDASTSYGDYYSSIEIEYDADKVNEAEQAGTLVGFLFGSNIRLNKDCETISKEILEKMKNAPVDIIKD